jgi:hypothetical protein
MSDKRTWILPHKELPELKYLLDAVPCWVSCRGEVTYAVYRWEMGVKGFYRDGDSYYPDAWMNANKPEAFHG